MAGEGSGRGEAGWIESDVRQKVTWISGRFGVFSLRKWEKWVKDGCHEFALAFV